MLKGKLLWQAELFHLQTVATSQMLADDSCEINDRF